ncbi:unnamed protein product [Prunus armeniaca]
MGERILRPSVKGNTERLNVLLLVVIASPRGVGGYAAAHFPGAGTSQREASWLGRHEGRSRVLKAWCVGK